MKLLMKTLLWGATLALMIGAQAQPASAPVNPPAKKVLRYAY